MIIEARTAADHEVIAVRFDEMAAEASRRAETHKRMAESYRRIGGEGVRNWEFEQHCNQIAAAAESDARFYRRIADGHRSMASKLK